MQVPQICYLLEATMSAMPLPKTSFLKYDSHLSKMRNVLQNAYDTFFFLAKLMGTVRETLRQLLSFLPKQLSRYSDNTQCC